jgi:hypothetical protein
MTSFHHVFLECNRIPESGRTLLEMHVKLALLLASCYCLAPDWARTPEEKTECRDGMPLPPG